MGKQQLGTQKANTGKAYNRKQQYKPGKKLN